jgi:hypothetical protein
MVSGNPVSREVTREVTRESQLINEYYDKIDRLVEVEYGDFKRKIGQYLLRLREGLVAAGSGGSSASGPVAAEIEKLRSLVVFDPNSDIETAREHVLSSLDRIRKLV